MESMRKNQPNCLKLWYRHVAFIIVYRYVFSFQYGLAGEDNPQGEKDPNKRAQAIMNEFDTNKDKKLTIDEFIIAYEHILKSSFSDFF